MKSRFACAITLITTNVLLFATPQASADMSDSERLSILAKIETRAFEEAIRSLIDHGLGRDLPAEIAASLETAALAAVKPIPAADDEANRGGYELLHALAPDTPLYEKKIAQYTLVGPGEYWIDDPEAKHPGLFTCASLHCGQAGAVYHGNKLTAYEIEAGFARVSQPYDIGCTNGRMDGAVDSGPDACTSENGVENGQIARWIRLAYLSESEPDADMKVASDLSYLASSDDFGKYQDIFAHAAIDLIDSRLCSKEDFREMGGWASSPAKGRGVYFIWCNNYADRYYLDTARERVFRD